MMDIESGCTTATLVMPSVKRPTGGLNATLARPATRLSKCHCPLQTTTGP
uniref:Alternative protein LOXL3 n=1 Tax=Homo sapiens TaxID=9606 RepID=L8E911_HUMAN|nr:alternative protein LOXL3 [Homo sapiens]